MKFNFCVKVIHNHENERLFLNTCHIKVTDKFPWYGENNGSVNLVGINISVMRETVYITNHQII